MKRSAVPEPELSRPLLVEKISAGGLEEHIVARPAERKALAARFDLLDLPRLEAHLTIAHARDKMIVVKGSFSATVMQACVVTLEPLTLLVQDTVDVLFAPPHLLDQGAGPSHVTSEDDEPPEPIIDGVIDLGEVVAQHLGGALDPYPRKAGLPATSSLIVGTPAHETPTSPFADLAARVRKE